MMRAQERDFYVAMPVDEHGLKTRFEIMGHMVEMLKMRFMSIAIWTTATVSLLGEYAELLCGKTVWGYVVKGSHGKPL